MWTTNPTTGKTWRGLRCTKQVKPFLLTLDQSLLRKPWSTQLWYEQRRKLPDTLHIRVVRHNLHLRNLRDQTVAKTCEECLSSNSMVFRFCASQFQDANQNPGNSEKPYVDATCSDKSKRLLFLTLFIGIVFFNLSRQAQKGIISWHNIKQYQKEFQPDKIMTDISTWQLFLRVRIQQQCAEFAEAPLFSRSLCRWAAQAWRNFAGPLPDSHSLDQKCTNCINSAKHSPKIPRFAIACHSQPSTTTKLSPTRDLAFLGVWPRMFSATAWNWKDYRKSFYSITKLQQSAQILKANRGVHSLIHQL